MKFCELTESEFSRFEEKNPFGNVMQTVERAKLREKMGFHSFLLGIKDENKVLAAGLVVEKNGEVWVQIGPILDWKDSKLIGIFLNGVLDFCKKKEFNELEIFPPVLISLRNTHGEVIDKYDCVQIFDEFKKMGFSHLGFTKKIENKALRWMFVKDLSNCKNMREVELTFSPTRRNLFHRAQHELEVYQLTKKDELKEWIVGLRDSDEKNGIHTRDLAYFRDLWDCYGDKAVFLEARKKQTGEIVASEVNIWHKNELVVFLSGIPTKFRRDNGVTALRGWQIEECLKRKIMRFNMYGIDGDFSDDNALLATKKSFGGYVEEYIGGFRIIINPWKYFLGKIRRRFFK